MEESLSLLLLMLMEITRLSVSVCLSPGMEDKQSNHAVCLGNGALGEMLSPTEKGLKLSQTSFGSEPSTPGEASPCQTPKMLGLTLHCPAPSFCVEMTAQAAG